MNLKKRLLQNNLLGQITRFLITGGLNTLLTIFIYQIALFYFSHNISYVIAWSIGILWVLYLYPRFVFKTKNISYKKNIATIFSYIFSFFLGLFLLNFFVIYVDSRIAIVISTGIVTIINFLLGRFIWRN